MHDYLEKSEIAAKIRKETDSLELLKESLERSDKMKQNMLGILNSFEKRLTRLEDTIMPIYQETGNLQRRHENIEKTVVALDQVIGYYNVAEEVEPIMRDGPSSNLKSYIDCLDRLSRAVKFHVNNSQGSSAMSDVLSLFEAGKEAMEKEFHNLLAYHGKPVSSAILVELISNDEEVTDTPLPQSASSPLINLPEVPLNSLKLISKWLQECGYMTNFTGTYARARSEVLYKSLRDLRSHLKSMPAKETTVLFNVGVTNSPSVKGKLKETPRKQIRSVANRASTLLKKQQDSPAYKPLGGLTSDTIEVDANPFIVILPGLLKLVHAESLLMQDIIPEKNKREIFDSIVLSGLDFVVKEGEQICQSVRKYQVKHNCTPVTQILPVVRQLNNYKQKFQKMIKDCQPVTKDKFASLSTSLHTTVYKSLEEFIDCIRNDPEKLSLMPRDGTVHELTSNVNGQTMFFMEQLLEYSDVIGSVLLLQDSSLHSQNVQPSSDPKQKLAEYFTKILSALGLNLNNKAEVYSDFALKAIFMMNNFNYILVSLRRSGMLDVVHLWNVEVESFYEGQITNQKRIYSQSWSRVLHFITDGQQQVSPLPPDTKGFNKELEEICRQQKIFSVPDLDLRQSLLEDNRTFVVPYYAAFLGRYKNANFTKNPDKYIKYSEQELVKCINGFFDSSA